MRQLKILTFFISFLSFSSFGTSIGSDTIIQKLAVDSSRIVVESFNNLSLLKLDTNLTKFQRYGLNKEEGILTLGNNGLSYFSLIPSFELPTRFNYGLNIFPLYAVQPLAFIAPKGVKSLTDLLLVLGSKKEQYVEVKHGQQFSKTITGGINLRKIRSEGFFNKQNADVSSINVFSEYLSARQIYRLRAEVMINRSKHQENGGILSDTILNRNIFLEQRVIPVNLQNAMVSRRGNSYLLQQNINIFSSDKDSSGNRKHVLIQFGHSFQYSATSFSYKDAEPNSGFYRNVFSDTILTKDTTHNSAINNKFEIGIRFLKNYHLKNGFEIEHITLNHPKTAIPKNLYYYNSLSSHSSSKNKFSLNSYYCFSGYNQNDYQIKPEFINESLADSAMVVVLTGTFQKRKPDLYFQEYLSNHFKWNNSFNSINRIEFEGAIELKKRKMKVKVEFNQLKKWIYFNSTAVPAQYENKIQIISSTFEKGFTFKRWNFLNSITFQKEFTQADVIRFPSLIYYGSLFYETKLFKRALTSQIGVDLQYFSAYKGYNYMPAITSFYLQDRIMIGNYPLIDFFINMKIKNRARIFFKVEHLNYGLTGTNFYALPNYAYPGRAFKLGINWNFIN